MNRQELAAYLTGTYSVEGERLFSKYPSFLVFRHNGNRKWFAVIMDIPRKNMADSATARLDSGRAGSPPAVFGMAAVSPAACDKAAGFQAADGTAAGGDADSHRAPPCMEVAFAGIRTGCTPLFPFGQDF